MPNVQGPTTAGLATRSGVKPGAITIDQRPPPRLHASASLEEILLEGCHLLHRGLLQPYSFPTRIGDLDAPEIFGIQLLSVALPVLVYALETRLPQHTLGSGLGGSRSGRFVRIHSMLEHEPTQKLRRGQQLAAGGRNKIGHTPRTLPDGSAREQCRPTSHTNDDMTAGPQHAMHLGQRTRRIWEVKECKEREDDVKGLVRKIELLRVHLSKGYDVAQIRTTRFGPGLLHHSPRMIYADDPASGQQSSHPKCHETGSRADIEYAIRGLQLRQFYHPHRDRRAEALREAVELRRYLIVALGIDLLVRQEHWPDGRKASFGVISTMPEISLG